MARPRLSLAESSPTDAKALFADAQERLSVAKAEHESLVQQFAGLQQQATALNTRGVELQKLMLGIEGDIKALAALKDTA